MTIRQRALALIRAGLLIGALATVLGTISAMHGDWIAWLFDVTMFVVAAGCTIVNYRIWRRYR